MVVVPFAYEAFVRALQSNAGVSIFELIMIGFAMSCLAGLMLLKKGYVRFISSLLVALIWLTSNGFAATSYGVRDASYIINFAIVLMAGLLLGLASLANHHFLQYPFWYCLGIMRNRME